MTQETICPACGAPLVVSMDENEVRCGFCGADLKVVTGDGEPHFEVAAQPAPQKDVLSRPVEPGIGPVNPVTPESPADLSDASTRDTVFQPFMGTGPEQTAPAREFQSAQPDFGVPTPPATQPGYQSDPFMPSAPSSGGAAVYSAAPTSPASSNKRWITIAAIVAGVLLLLCVCGAIALFAILRNNNGF